jgi:hypothetical protein
MSNVTVKGGNQPQAIHAGLNVAVMHVSLSSSWSSTDVHFIGKIPHGAIPVDAVFYAGAASPATFVAKFGTSASAELFGASQSWSLLGPRGTVALTRKYGYAVQVSLSDDAMPRFENVIMTATAGCSIGHVGDLIVSYVMPGQTA